MKNWKEKVRAWAQVSGDGQGQVQMRGVGRQHPGRASQVWGPPPPKETQRGHDSKERGTTRGGGGQAQNILEAHSLSSGWAPVG